MDDNILHHDVIVDTDNLLECSSSGGGGVSGSLKCKRKWSTSTDGDSTNYELIEYLKRREKRDDELLRRMDAREERLVGLLERTVVAIEALVQYKCTHHHSPSHNTIVITENSTKICNGNVAHLEATASAVLDPTATAVVSKETNEKPN